jgi:hypothetical protein
MGTVMDMGFYPACKRHSNRRTFLKLALGAGIAPAIGVGSPGLRQPVEGATQLIERHALTPHDPWALVHAIRALGGECRLGGEHAATYVLRTYAAKRAVNGRYYLHFPARVEIHTNMFLKTFLEEPSFPDPRDAPPANVRAVLRQIIEKAL